MPTTDQKRKAFCDLSRLKEATTIAFNIGYGNNVMTFKLSVLDQSSTRSPDDTAEAFKETIETAKLCESLGYERFWLSEHHAFPVVAGSAPEVLLAAVGSATDRIRIGSGGIMLPHYSPYKVAEQFSTLANLFPQRVDLGVGRAPGADMSTAQALSRDGKPRFHEFPQQLASLSAYLWDKHAQPRVSPKPPEGLPIWVLGSSIDSALLAAELGMPYNLGAFINPDADPYFTQVYRERFKPSKLWPAPYVIVTMSVFCAESEALAQRQAHTFDVNFFRFITGRGQEQFLNPEQAAQEPEYPGFSAFVQRQRKACAVGTPQQVKADIERFADAFQADEIMAVSNIYAFEERQESFKLLKAAFDT